MSKNKRSISGRNLYQDDKGRNILFNRLDGSGYLIKEKDEKNFHLYSNRYILVAAGVILSMNFIVDLKFSLLIGGIILIALEFMYRTKFLPSLTKIFNFKPYTQVTLVDQLVQKGNKSKVLMTAIAYPVLSVLIVLNGYQLKMNNWMMAINIIIAIVALYISSMYWRAYFKLNK